ncbi:HEAT repeat domain-containing protein [Mesorhizobium sp. VK24D]|uniref:HEAT repeat domain-containing protein n=1 Tax=Mesorhizobium album TaxID=3072314 RepID=A0ABU4Y1G3_9HYPH|nr:HEAT repeat domain-containing protein [Mesorhizobium sp. VK24D]MDX8479737.1 HEAT repeat domain-containing protein [Mesorhizobium sp. VK24D]
MTVLENIVRQHAERSAALWAQRDSLVLDDPPDLDAVRAIDGRLEINLDGLRVAGRAAWPRVLALHEEASGKGELFVLAWTALELESADYVVRAVEIARSADDGPGGLLGALAWHEASKIAPWVRDWIDARDSFKRFLGVSACLEHCVDPKQVLAPRLRDPDASVRTASLQLAAKLGRTDLTPEIRNAVSDEDQQVRFWAAWTLSEFGRGDPSIAELRKTVERGDRNALVALRAVVKSTPATELRSWIGTLLHLPQSAPLGVRAAGMLGDRSVLPWLIEQMNNPAVATAAGASLLELFPETRLADDLFTNDPVAAGADFGEYFADRIARVPLADKVLEWGRRQGYVK